jgi:hypothetical protein
MNELLVNGQPILVALFGMALKAEQVLLPKHSCKRIIGKSSRGSHRCMLSIGNSKAMDEVEPPWLGMAL